MVQCPPHAVALRNIIMNLNSVLKFVLFMTKTGVDLGDSVGTGNSIKARRDEF